MGSGMRTTTEIVGAINAGCAVVVDGAWAVADVEAMLKAAKAAGTSITVRNASKRPSDDYARLLRHASEKTTFDFTDS